MTTGWGQVIGTCSLCGGPVRKLTCESPARCDKCFALAAEHGPVIPMVPQPVPGVRYVPAPVIYPEPYQWPPRYPWEFTFCSETRCYNGNSIGLLPLGAN